MCLRLVLETMESSAFVKRKCHFNDPLYVSYNKKKYVHYCIMFSTALIFYEVDGTAA